MQGCKKECSENFDFFAKLGRKVFLIMVEDGLVNERIARDIMIKEEYKKLIDSGIKSKEARKLLSERLYTTAKGEKYYLGVKNIEKIIYSNK
jgi:hypothetical protein